MEELRELKRELEDLLGVDVLLSYVSDNNKGWKEEINIIAGAYRITITGFKEEMCEADIWKEEEYSKFEFKYLPDFLNIFALHYEI